MVNNALFNVSGGTITVGKDAFFGHDVAILTGTHDIEKFGRERQLAFPRSGRDVVIGEGVWLASHVLVLGPLTIGEHAVVAGGSLVREDVAPYTVVAGRPAKVVKTIARPDAARPPERAERREGRDRCRREAAPRLRGARRPAAPARRRGPAGATGCRSRRARSTALRANHVLEHQSYELIGETLREWARVLAPGGRLDIGVPDARFVAEQWVRGEIDTAEANYWILGGHSDRAAHRGVDARGVPLWIWNAHHTMFDAGSLRAAVEEFFDVEELFTYDIRNLRLYGRAPLSPSASESERGVG